MLIAQYYPVFLFIAVAIGFAGVILCISYLRSKQNPSAEKSSTYECGFEPMTPKIKMFNVRFYLVSVLFIIFDVEIAFLYPWAVTLNDTGVWGFLSMLLFLSILTIAFIYEWRKGALEWD